MKKKQPAKTDANTITIVDVIISGANAKFPAVVLVTDDETLPHLQEGSYSSLALAKIAVARCRRKFGLKPAKGEENNG